jgi:hypothetical protein
LIGPRQKNVHRKIRHIGHVFAKKQIYSTTGFQRFRKKKKNAFCRFLPSCRFHGGVLGPNIKSSSGYHIENGLHEACGEEIFTNKACNSKKQLGDMKNEMTSSLAQPSKISL